MKTKVIYRATFNADFPDYVKRWVKAKRMRDAGFTYAQIGKALGVSPTMGRVLAIKGERRIKYWDKHGFPDFWGMGLHTNLPKLETEVRRIGENEPKATMAMIDKMAGGMKARDWLHV